MTEQEEKRLLAELKKLPDYDGWTFVHVYPEYFSYYRAPYSVYFTPDWEAEGRLPIQVQDDEGHVYEEYGKTLPLPRAGRTGAKLFALVRPTLDALARTRVSHAAKRFAKKKTARSSIRTAYVRRYPDTGQRTAHVEWSDGSWTSGDPSSVHMRALLERAKREGVHVLRYG